MCHARRPSTRRLGTSPPSNFRRVAGASVSRRYALAVRLAQLILFTGDLDAGGVVLALHALRNEPAVIAPVPREASYWKPCFHADDVEATRAALVAAGATMRDIHRFDDVVLCDGCDPDGNVFQITTR